MRLENQPNRRILGRDVNTASKRMAFRRDTAFSATFKIYRMLLKLSGQSNLIPFQFYNAFDSVPYSPNIFTSSTTFIANMRSDHPEP